MAKSKASRAKTAKAPAEETKGDANASKDVVVAEHLPPIGLVMSVMVCSSIMWVFAFRDTFATGKIIGGPMDHAMLIFTKSLDWFDDSKGWKSQQGGLSAIVPVTTDANNMGGFFVRKMAGAAALAVHTQKLMPLLFHPLDARWKMGHFRPMLWTATLSNMMLAAFYGYYLNDLEAAGADGLPKLFIGILTLEAIIILGYLIASRSSTIRGPAVAMEQGKTPKSPPSKIVSRTVAIVSTAMALIAGRDLLFPGEIMDFIPRDDIYLEWTNAFFHSAPDGTPEASEYGITSALYVGDKFVSQLMALNILILAIYKFLTAVGISYGSDGSGMPKARMIWKAQFIGDGLMLLLFRLFSQAALSASLDLRWHLMCVAYETFILGLYGFF